MQRLVSAIEKIRVGMPGDEPEAFMGPVISTEAARTILLHQVHLVSLGGKALVATKRLPRHPGLLTPGLIDVTEVENWPDIEVFGPLLQLIFVENFEAAIEEANRTSYGLSCALISENAGLYEQFLRGIRGGVIAWNRPMTGASSHLPFGGIGNSGNHRPGGYFAADYAAYPVAALESATARIPEKLPPGLEISR